nr:IS1182 family transposase [Eubacterium callanderi]
MKRDVVEVVNTDALVPREHLLRKIDQAIDFEAVYDFVEALYCSDNGRPSADPVVLIKMVFIQHFATISYAFRHRFTETVVEQIFTWVLSEVERAGYLKPEVVFVDATHIKANANLKKKVKRAIPGAAKTDEAQLFEEVNQDREKHGKKPFNGPKPPKERVVNESTTDLESGIFQKGEHRQCFAYSAHTVCERNNFVLEVTVTPGNVHDSQVFDVLDQRVTTTDAGYKTPWIAKQIFEDGRIPSLPYKRPMTKKGFYPKYEYVYDVYNDWILCPNHQTLYDSTTNRQGYQIYKNIPFNCEQCPAEKRRHCTESKTFEKTVNRHIWEDYLERAEDVRHSPLGKISYALRSQTIERVFADAKEKHAMRYTLYRGLKAVTNWVRLKVAAMNLKKLALWKAKASCSFSFVCIKRTLIFLFNQGSLTI